MADPAASGISLLEKSIENDLATAQLIKLDILLFMN